MTLKQVKLGARVIGNDLAAKYGITIPGWIGVITGVEDESIEVCGPNETHQNEKFLVKPECFDLIDKPKARNLPSWW